MRASTYMRLYATSLSSSPFNHKAVPACFHTSAYSLRIVRIIHQLLRGLGEALRDAMLKRSRIRNQDHREAFRGATAFRSKVSTRTSNDDDDEELGGFANERPRRC